MNTEITIDDLDILEICLFKQAKKIGTKLYPNNASYQQDIRYTTYITISGIIRTAKLSFIFRKDQLDQTEWWDQNFDRYFDSLKAFLPIDHTNRISMKQNYYISISKDFQDFLEVGLYSSIYSMMESRFRLFYNYFMKPDKAGEIEDRLSFSKLSCNLLNKFQLAKYENTIKLFASIRNTVHNNGVYTQEDTILSYKDRIYIFRKGKATGYDDPLYLLIYKIVPDILYILNKMINELDGYESINDPFAVDD
jgi:hypothetical protein